MPNISGLEFTDLECMAPCVQEYLDKGDLLRAAFEVLTIVENDQRLRLYVWQQLMVKTRDNCPSGYRLTRELIERMVKEICDAKKLDITMDHIHHSAIVEDWN